MKPLSRDFLVKRGFCCSAKCTNCPYDPKWSGGSKLRNDDGSKTTGPNP